MNIKLKLEKYDKENRKFDYDMSSKVLKISLKKTLKMRIYMYFNGDSHYSLTVKLLASYLLVEFTVNLQRFFKNVGVSALYKH